MRITFNLNGNSTEVTAEPTESLLKVLRKNGLHSVKCGCGRGVCGNCTVLLNGKAVSSCLVPVGIARGCEIVTLEYFRSDPLYQDIMSGFTRAGVSMCGYCNAGKIFTAYMILRNSSRPTAEQVLPSIQNLDMCCTDSTTLTNGILYAANAMRERERKAVNAKK